MSLQSHFVERATSEGLHIPGAPGSQTSETAAYGAVLARARQRHANAQRLLSGNAIVGHRVDSRSPNAREDAEFLARAAEWADFLAGKFPGEYGRLDSKDGRTRQVFADGRAFALSFEQQMSRGRADGGRGKRLDAVAPMASQGLSFILPEVYEYQHNSLPCWDGEFVKIYSGADPASNEVIWYEMDNIGLARASNSYDVTTIPMVNGPLASDNKILIVPALVGMETNFMDARRASLAERMGKPDFMIEVMKRQAAERTLAEFFDNLWFGGDATLGIDGLMNNPAVETVPITGAWASKTALQIFDDLVTMAWTIYNRTAGALADFGKIRIILPPEQFRRLSLPITSAGSATILEYFNNYWASNKGQTVGAPKVELQARLAASNSYAYNGGPNILSSDTALIVYEDGNPNVDPTLVLTQPIEVPAPVRVTGVGEVTYFHARGGGLKLPDARRMKYVVGL